MADTRAEHVNQLAELISDVEVAMFHHHRRRRTALQSAAGYPAGRL